LVAFEAFTEQARAAIVPAQGEARDMGHGAVQVEHLLLDLFSDEDDIVDRVWADFGLTIQPVREMVRERLGVVPGSRPEGQLPFSPTALGRRHPPGREKRRQYPVKPLESR
jgi:ATP-dependent Clp protease ATP-binding subunit ClpA